MNLALYWQACRKLLTLSVVCGWPAVAMALILLGSADIPEALKMWPNHETDVAPNVHLLRQRVRPLALILARHALRLVSCSSGVFP